MSKFVEIKLSEKDFEKEKFGSYLLYMARKGDHEICRVDGIELPHGAQLFRLLNHGGRPYSVILEPSEFGMPAEFSAVREDEAGLIERFRDTCRIADKEKP